MNRIQTLKKWDGFKTIQVLFLEEDEVICEYCFEVDAETISTLHGVYVYPNHRGKKLFNMMMEDCIALAKSKEEEQISLKVREDNFIKDKYSKYGFKPDGNPEENLGYKYQWMILNLNKK